jgi:hypothetical protein
LSKNDPRKVRKLKRTPKQKIRIKERGVIRERISIFKAQAEFRRADV